MTAEESFVLAFFKHTVLESTLLLAIVIARATRIRWLFDLHSPTFH